MNPELMIFLLLVAGLVLIVMELFVPSGGMIAVMCVCCFAGSAFYAYRAWYTDHPAWWWGYLASLIVLIPAAVIGTFRLIATTSLGHRVLLAAPSEEEITPYQKEQDHLQSLIGKRGRSLNLMTPGGMVKVGSERLHAISDGLMIEPNMEIEVVATRGNRVVVRPVENIGTQEGIEPNFAETEPGELDEEQRESVDPFSSEEAV
ncbi:MAG: hypothetical protein KDA36_08675 [Planctomycetaceae bacterium]|nr:hypothetical protein [Planctomycetaceae bacterium]MCA9098447.1 hypothetical protein [Planctomycetaceae bacterium]